MRTNSFTFIAVLLSSISIITAAGCGNSQREKELELKARELDLREKELAIKISDTLAKPQEKKVPDITMEEAVKLAKEQFEKSLPEIERSYNGQIDLMDPYTGDFTGDGIEDVLIYFSLSPKDGGNNLVGQGLMLYQNTGKEVKKIAVFKPDYLFSFNSIKNGKIIINKLEFTDDDPRCCPSISTEKTLTISGSSVY
ncbi:MAG: hypothetical protein WBP45_12535 [Daejeonella sp.]